MAKNNKIQDITSPTNIEKARYELEMTQLIITNSQTSDMRKNQFNWYWNRKEGEKERIDIRTSWRGHRSSLNVPFDILITYDSTYDQN